MNLESNLQPQKKSENSEHRNEESIEGLKKALETLKSGVQELAKTHHFKLERIAASLKRMDEVQSHLRQEIARNYAELSGKVQERRLAESKINDLILRHDLMVANFDSRLAQMKKTVDDKEMRFLQTQSALEAVHREIQKFK